MKKSVQLTFNIFSILLGSIYLLSCLTPYIHPGEFWPFTFLALAFPITALILVIVLVAWLFINPAISLLLLLTLSAGFKNLSNTFAINKSQPFEVKKDYRHLRIISWNVRAFDNNLKLHESPDSVRRKMINFLRKMDADVLLLQEFTNDIHPSFYSNTRMLHDTLGYTYYYTSKDLVMDVPGGTHERGNAIFSRLPLYDTTRLCYKNLALNECAVSADIIFENKKIKLFTTHLVSMNLKKGLIHRTDEAFRRYDSAYIYGTSTFNKLIHYDVVHSNQATELRNLANKSKFPLVISGDLNSTPTSFTYRTIKGNLQDAFLKKGLGIGRTFVSLSPTLRIDCIFADQQLDVVQFYHPNLYLSDHFPLITDLQWK